MRPIPSMQDAGENPDAMALGRVMIRWDLIHDGWLDSRASSTVRRYSSYIIRVISVGEWNGRVWVTGAGTQRKRHATTIEFEAKLKKRAAFKRYDTITTLDAHRLQERLQMVARTMAGARGNKGKST